MKIYILVAILVLNAFALFAQVEGTPKKADSTAAKAAKLNPASLKQTDGGSMLRVNDITTNISTSPELSTFYKAVQATGLNETFKTRGPVTVFAPDNQAFLNLSKGKLDSLLMPARKYDLIALVTYHTLPGKLSAKKIAHEINAHKGLATFITLTGSKLTARLDENRNIILIDENGGQSVIRRFDIEQNNGLVHITNAVLIPKFKNI